MGEQPNKQTPKDEFFNRRLSPSDFWRKRPVKDNTLPTYAVFDDYRHVASVAVYVRWFMLITWFFLHNYRGDYDDPIYFTNNGMAAVLSAFNAYVTWRIWKGRPITLGLALGPSVADLLFITAGIFTSSGFGNTFFVLYYPALLAMAMVSPSRTLSFAVAIVVAANYAVMSVLTEPGVDLPGLEEKVLVIRVAAMLAVVVAANLMHRAERTRRQEAVAAAQDAELAARKERDRIGRDIHDGIAQSIAALSLNLETTADLADGNDGSVGERVRKLVPLAQKTLLETRQYIDHLRPLLTGERSLESMAQSQVQEFRTVAGTPAELYIQGRSDDVSVPVVTAVFRILQEALANVLKHAQAQHVDVSLAFEPGMVRLSVKDDGVGVEADGLSRGYGLDNMRQRAEELAGLFEITGQPGEGTTVTVALPARGEQDETH